MSIHVLGRILDILEQHQLIFFDAVTLLVRSCNPNRARHRHPFVNSSSTILGDPNERNVQIWEASSKALNDGFKGLYRGTAAQEFEKALKKIYEEIYSKDKHYGRIIPILQSSGTGKSRLVSELGRKIPTISICFRDDERPESGWPPRDTPAHVFLCENRGGATVEEIPRPEEVAAAFLGALFFAIAREISSIMDTGNVDAERSMRAWEIEEVFATSKRYELFSIVADDAYSLLQDNREQLKRHRKPIKPADSKDTYLQIFQILCSPGREELGKMLKARNFDRFIVAFDECTQLNKPLKSEASSKSYMSLIALMRILKADDETDTSQFGTFWYPFLDTNLSVKELAPSGPTAPSHRQQGQLQPLPIWFFLDFDQMAAKHTPLTTPNETLKLKHIKRYGRPYWSTIQDNILESSVEVKLFRSTSFDPTSDLHVFAAFSNRLLLEIGPGESGSRLATESVCSHMRFLIGAGGGLLETDAPSDPMLAAAAAKALNRAPAGYRLAIQTLLKQMILNGTIIDRGLNGELCSRFLLMLARDQATTDYSRRKDEVTENFVKDGSVQTTTLSKLLRSLCGTEALESLPDHEDLFKLCDGGHVNFTHFVQLESPIGIKGLSQDFLYEVWCRHAALQCSFGQPIIDGLIIVYYGTLDDEPLHKSQLGYVVWQTKNRVTAAGAATVQELLGPKIQGKTKEPYVALFMDLGTETTFEGGTDRMVDLSYSEPAALRDEDAINHIWRDDPEPKRFCLNIRGHRKMQYPVLDAYGCGKEFDQLYGQHLVSSEPMTDGYRDQMKERFSVFRTRVGRG